MLYLYSEVRKQWELLLVRVTNTSKAKVKYDNVTGSIIAISKAGKKLVSIPIEGMNLDYDRSEQP